MKKIAVLTLLISLMIIGLAGCKTDQTEEAQPPADRGISKSDLSVCGDFPRSIGDGGPTTRYSVCLDIATGNCFYKKAYQQPIEGCDPEISDENPYGNDECFETVTDTYNADGKSDTAFIGKKANCQMTTQDYFESKAGN